ncbi:DNA-dependent metalloprotease dvc-1 [Anabrus simplex]|uniref:DNA-dependent metalloprotease dvc-1 n=1 Tax=Anabrus simplex TaxID=316456 RepID=UPI0035A334E7
MHFDEDYAVALRLQEQFDRENHLAKPSFLDIPGKTPVKDKKWTVGNKENVVKKASSLVDPSWEYIDPTPDIHAMFIQFNKRFFWQQLDAVEVRWSPRMTKCAGICCYQGRRGLCSIRLSLPLLKLRPRKDLVETLLHEMIHAYLFVTCNNRDRDGHGPEFHKHMHRINKEAGTNITVYHSFHAEVKLYQQHWWRCDGPCHKRPPFFGMVKRAMNRAPGPADFWWAQHQATCGGKFVKVREPEGYSKKQSASKSVKSTKVGSPSKDIRSYFGGRGSSLKPPTGNIASSGKFGKKSVPKPVVPFPNDFGRTSSASGRGKGGFRGGMLANKGGGTVVITPKGKVKNSDKTETETKGSSSSSASDSVPSSFVPFSGKGYTLGAPVSTGDKPWLSWLDKLESSAPKQNKPESFQKRTPPLLSKRKGIHDKTEDDGKRSKSGKDPDSDRQTPSCSQPVESRVSCPSCNARVMEELLNDHLDLCLQGVFSSDYTVEDNKKNVKCVVCDGNIDEDNANSRLCNDCVRAAENAGAGTNCDNAVSCPMCDKQVAGDDLDRHLETCVASALNDGVVVISDDDSDEEPAENGELGFPCPCCGSMVQQTSMNSHLDECLSTVFLEDESSPF